MLTLIVIGVALGIYGAEALRNFVWKVSWPELIRLTKVGHDAQREQRHTWQKDREADKQREAPEGDPVQAEMRIREAAYYNEVHRQMTEAMRERAQRSFRQQHRRSSSPFEGGSVVDGDFYVVED